ncbi:MAG TPA: hypothetical protein VMV04_17555 [Thermodesulfobacteriota bacterium]|nr:hypothetical protein [Thermodesulfobacteriota bacterium]
MDKSLSGKPDYGNWVSKKFVYLLGAISLLFWGISFVFPASAVVAAIFLLIALYFAYARYRLSPAGGNVQTQIQELVLHHLDWNGKAELFAEEDCRSCWTGEIFLIDAKNTN